MQLYGRREVQIALHESHIPYNRGTSLLHDRIPLLLVVKHFLHQGASQPEDAVLVLVSGVLGRFLN